MVFLEENSFKSRIIFPHWWWFSCTTNYISMLPLLLKPILMLTGKIVAWRWLCLPQVKFCKRNPGFMDSVRLGAVRAIDECQYQVRSIYRPDRITTKGENGFFWINLLFLQFRARRWNCSSLQDSLDQQVTKMIKHLLLSNLVVDGNTWNRFFLILLWSGV